MEQSELISKLLEDSDLQKVAVGALLERGDARSWSLIQQVRLVESQLAALTSIEMDRKKLEVDEQVVSFLSFLPKSILFIPTLEKTYSLLK